MAAPASPPPAENNKAVRVWTIVRRVHLNEPDAVVDTLTKVVVDALWRLRYRVYVVKDQGESSKYVKWPEAAVVAVHLVPSLGKVMQNQRELAYSKTLSYLEAGTSCDSLVASLQRSPSPLVGEGGGVLC